ncbi:unnamed protein product [Leptidea sinapis]|uniref:Uncharacterized protein n=1 Tax=Leptidea sinapis TaxID=189913 RepID=A0A5E4PUU4_9NEOP|nr:unnamed protein product [Leptidea sinapis]
MMSCSKNSRDVRMNVLIEPYISVRDKVSLIQNITLEELQDFTDRFLDKLYLQILMQGNIAWTDAIKISENVLKNIKWEGLPEAELPVANRNWREITSCEYKFQRLLIEAEAIDKVKMSDIRKWVADHFAVGNKSRFRKLSIQVVGHLPNSADNATQGESGVHDHSLQLLHAGQPSTNIEENQEEFITSIDDFKKSLPLVNTPRVELAQC